MADRPDPAVTILHSAASSSWSDGDALAAQLTDRLPNLDLRMAETPPESEQLISDAEIVLTGRLGADLLDHADELRWAQAISSGVDFYDFDLLREADVSLTNAAGVHAQPIAEQVLGYMLTFERQLHHAHDNQRDRLWSRFSGGELRGKTVGIVGVGAIGGRVAELTSAIGMDVIGTKRDTSSAPDAVDEIYSPDELYDVLSASDYLVVACPLTEETRGLIGREELGVLPADSVLVNIARGSVVDQDALVRALQYRSIRGAALDVFEEEPLPEDSLLWELPNAVLTPHMAGSSPHKTERLAELFADNYRRYVEDGVEGLRNRVV